MNPDNCAKHLRKGVRAARSSGSSMAATWLLTVINGCPAGRACRWEYEVVCAICTLQNLGFHRDSSRPQADCLAMRALGCFALT